MLERKWLRLRYRIKCLAADPPPRVVHLHIPKCGGTTVTRHFKMNIGGGRSGKLAMLDSMICHAYDEDAFVAARSAQYVTGHFGWRALKAVRQSAFCFTVLRVPFNRLRSLYLFSRSRKASNHRCFAALFEAAKQRSFGDFCLSQELEIRAFIDNAITRTLGDDYFPFDVSDPKRTLIAAKAHLDVLDMVIDAAKLNAALPELARLTKTKLLAQQQSLNKTPHSDLALLSEEEFRSDRRLVRLIAQDDLLYKYAFESPRSPVQRLDLVSAVQ